MNHSYGNTMKDSPVKAAEPVVADKSLNSNIIGASNNIARCHELIDTLRSFVAGEGEASNGGPTPMSCMVHQSGELVDASASLANKLERLMGVVGVR